MSVAETKTVGRRVATVTQMPHISGYQWLTTAALRHLIFSANDRIASNGDILPGNGLDNYGAVIRIGRRVLIDLDRFDEWVDAHRTSGQDLSAANAGPLKYV